MRTCKEFNTKYINYLEESNHGLTIEIPAVISYVDNLFKDLILIPGFKYTEIKTVYGLTKVYTNLDEILPLIGRFVHQELEEKINFILKVEYEIENRLYSLNLDKNGKPLQSL